MKKLAWALAAALAAPLFVGCSAAPSTYRGQSPAAPGGAIEQTSWYDSTCPNCQSGQCDGHHFHLGGLFGAGPVGPPPGCEPPAGGRRGVHHMLGIGPGGIGGGWYPTHHHTFDYEPPEDLVYPPQNQPAAVVQYPYYTLKGPDDFFLTETR